MYFKSVSSHNYVDESNPVHHDTFGAHQIGFPAGDTAFRTDMVKLLGPPEACAVPIRLVEILVGRDIN